MLDARMEQRHQIQLKRRKLNTLRFSHDNYMTQAWVNELLTILQKEKWRFYYRRDDYAYVLLSYATRGATPLHAMRRSPYKRLLSKSALKPLMASLGDGQLKPEHLLPAQWEPRECYLLTLDQWGEPATRYRSWQQTSRPGKNLVLQLNFSNQHNRPYHEYINPICFHPFEYDGHPIAVKPRYTMAWVRIDIANDLSHALIEEIQNDWLRDAHYYRTWRRRIDERNGQRRRVKQYCNEVGVTKKAWQAYEGILATHKKIWAEAALTAAIVLLKEEMGINRIFYHTYASGNILKGFTETWAPPKSLYTKLPERFCFRKTQESPPMLEKHIEALRDTSQQKWLPLEFYLLDLA